MFPTYVLRIVTGLAIGFAISIVPGFGQKGGGGAPSPAPPSTTTPGTSPGGGIGRPGTGNSPFPGQQTPGQQQPGQNYPQQMERPVFLSGKVMLDDGTPPPDSVVIERVCNGRPRPEGYTDSKGRFSFQLGQNSSMMQDASYDSSGMNTPGMGGGMSRGGVGGGGMGSGGMGGMSRGTGERDLMGCELRAVLAGYRSESINLANHRMFDDPNVGTIILHRMGNVEGTTISATSLQAPKDAKKAFDKGREALKKNKPADAEKSFQKAVDAYPKYAVAWFELGQLQQKNKNFEEARKSYAQALAADSRYISPYLQLSLMAAQEKKWEEVVETTNRAVKLDAFDFPQAYFYNSVANYNLHRLDAAEKSAREAQKVDTEHRFPQVNHLLGVILAEKRDFSGAAEQMRTYLKFAPGAQDADTVRTQLSEIEKLAAPTAKANPQQP